jgi:energy-coupling factor transporter ATP-binding protein EcfA2
MILRGIHIEHWRCIAKLDLEDLPAGIVVLYGPNRTGKSSLVKALRGCLFDFDHDTVKAELKSCLPWNKNGPPRLAVEFEIAGRIYCITKVFSKKSDGLTKLEQQDGAQWRVVENSPKEASRRTRELLGADKSTLGLNQLLWLDQGDIHLPDAKELDGSLERQLVSVLGVLVTGHDVGFKQALEKRCERWFGVSGRHKPTSPVNLWEQEKETRQKRCDELLAKRREIEQAICDREDCENRLPVLEKEVVTARQELAEREQERERGRERRLQFQQALRDFRAAEQQVQSARKDGEAYAHAKARWQEAETEAVRAEAARQAACEERDRQAAEHAKIATELQTARLAEEQSQPAQEEIQDRRKLLELAERLARLAKDLARGRQLQQRTEELQKQLQETAVPDKATLEGLRENRQQAGKHRAQLHAGELTLTVTLQGSAPFQLRLDNNPDKTETCQPGQKVSWPFRQRARVDLPDVGSIEVNRSQENLDLERTVAQLEKLDKAYRQTVLAFHEQPEDESCLNRLTERWVERESALGKLSEVAAEMQRLAPHGLVALESDCSRLESQRQIILERRPDLVGWQPSEEETTLRECDYRARSAALQESRKELEAAEKRANRARQHAETASTQCNEKAIAARTTARNSREELQRLGDELSLQAAADQAERIYASAEQRLAEVQLNEAEKSMEERYQAAQEVLKRRQERLQHVKDEMNRHRGRLEGSEGLHTRLADAEAALREAEEILARERLEAEAHKHLRDLFETCRDRQVQDVMGPIGARALDWVRSLGLGEYGEVRFGDRFLPEGLVLRQSDEEQIHAFQDESYGTGEQLSLLVRLAIGGVLAKDEPAVTILDDPLAHADPAKHRRILDMMRLAAEGNPAWTPPAGRLQILILTCHPERFDYLSGVRQIDLAKLIVREV